MSRVTRISSISRIIVHTVTCYRSIFAITTATTTTTSITDSAAQMH